MQEFNRDISIAAIQQFLKIRSTESENLVNSHDNDAKILEALSATGLRSIRYAKEINGVKEIVANDISKRAVASIANNVKATLTWFLWNMELLNIQLQKMNVDHLLNNPYVNEGTLREQNLY